jgi:hypothetical protein
VARTTYLGKAKPNAVEKYNQAKAHSEAVNNALSILPLAAEGLAKKSGHDLAQNLRQFTADSFKKTGENLSDEDRLRLIAEHGFEGYKAIRTGMNPVAENS